MTAESDWSPSESRAHISKPPFLVSNNAFYPIKDDFALDKGGDRRATDSLIRPLEERIAALEKSRKALENDVERARRDDDRKPKKEDMMRSNTDLITHLSYKMQVLSESVASLKGKVQGVDERSGDQQGSLRDVEKKLANLENTVHSAQDELINKQSNELLMMRDVMAELRARIDQQQRPKREDQDLASQVSSLQRVIDGLRSKQDSTERELERLKRRQEKDEDQEDWIRQLVDERCQRIIQKDDVGAKLNQLAKALSEEKAARQELQQKLRDTVEKSWDDHKTERLDETKKLRELVKSDKARTNASLHKLNDALINVMEKQMEEQKVNQEKLQAEVIARQQFECEALQKLIDIDEKTTRLSKHVNELSGTTHKVREELRSELEAQDTARKRAVKDLESKVVAKKKMVPVDDDSDWRGRTDLAITQLRQDVRLIHEASKDKEKEAMANSKKMEDMAANIRKMNGTLAEMENFKNDTLTSLDAVDKKIKNSNKKRPGVNEASDGSIDATPEQLKTMKEKLKKDEEQLRLLRKDLDACARKEDLEKLRQDLEKSAEGSSNEKVNEKIRTLANAIQITKGAVAMKMQHEEKMRLETLDHLQDQIDRLEKTIEKMRQGDDDEEEDEEGQPSEDGDKEKDNDENGQDKKKDKDKDKDNYKDKGKEDDDRKGKKESERGNEVKEKLDKDNKRDKDDKRDGKEKVDKDDKKNGKDKVDKKDTKEKRDKDEKKSDVKEKAEKSKDGKEKAAKTKDLDDMDSSRYNSM